MTEVRRGAERRSRPSARDESSSRAERKDKTRRALLDAALRGAENHSFDSLSLREVARAAGIVPTAFYRHFDSMAELGVALVDESMRTLRHLAREVRRARDHDLTVATVDLLLGEIQTNEAHYRFLMRERYGGSGPIRRAIEVELRLFTSELMVDLSRTGAFADVATEDLEMAADLMVSAMQAIVMAALDADRRHGEHAEVRARAIDQLRLIGLGLSHWKPGR